jgi:uncharacterized lipoprotein YddW (UPF0748 family)
MGEASPLGYGMRISTRKSKNDKPDDSMSASEGNMRTNSSSLTENSQEYLHPSLKEAQRIIKSVC